MADDSPRLPGLCLTMAKRALDRQKEIGRLLKSLRDVPPDRHDQALAIYVQALLEHGQLTGELNQLINSMQAARIAGLMIPDQSDMTPGLVPVPCRPPPEVPLEREQYLVLEVEQLPHTPQRRYPDRKSLAAGERGDDA